MTDIVVADLGGTHARFATAAIEQGRVVVMGEPVSLAVADYPDFVAAWKAFRDHVGHDLPTAAALAVAASVGGDIIRLTNNDWTLESASFADRIGVTRHIVINDFEAVGHAVDAAGEDDFSHLCGPEQPLPHEGRISIVGPGTGLGISFIARTGCISSIYPTEGGHFDFAPVDGVDDAILARLRARFGRVSVERVVAGPAIVDVHAALAAMHRRDVPPGDSKALWKAALDGSDPLAVAAMERIGLSLGSIAGDVALAQGASAVVIAGGMGLRLQGQLKQPGFAERFCAKGRYRAHMEAMPVKLITHPQPGLFGAAVAFARAWQ